MLWQWSCCGILAAAVGLAAAQQKDFSQCGRSTLVDGRPSSVFPEAKLGDHPHMCSIYRKVGKMNTFLGGASLIWSNMILTLATALEPFLTTKGGCGETSPQEGLYVRCGEVHLQAESRDLKSDSRQDRAVKRIFLHPGYNPRSLIQDFAILVVDTPFTFTQEVGRVCLPAPGQTLPAGLSCVATGHGKDGNEVPSFYTPILRQVTLPLWATEDCSRKLNEGFFRNTSVRAWRAHPSHLCAGGENNLDTCEGDGGGPLVCSLDRPGVERPKAGGGDGIVPESGDPQFDLRTVAGSWQVQVGITAWGIRCGIGLPGVYSNVAQAMCWVDQVMSCNLPEEENLLDLRKAEVSSVLGLTRGQCGSWQDTEASRLHTTCSCRPALRPEETPASSVVTPASSLETTASSLDLRGISV